MVCSEKTTTIRSHRKRLRIILLITDLTFLSLNLIGEHDLSGDNEKAADVDKDGKITLADLARMRQFLSRIIDKF